LADKVETETSTIKVDSQDLAILAEEVQKETSTINVDSVDLFKTGDSIRILPNTSGFPEEHTIQDLRSTAIYGAKIIIFKILPLYILPLRKSYNCQHKF
jgi:hypothetical protein